MALTMFETIAKTNRMHDKIIIYRHSSKKITKPETMTIKITSMDNSFIAFENSFILMTLLNSQIIHNNWNMSFINFCNCCINSDNFTFE